MWRLLRDKQLLIYESHGDLNRCTPYRGKPDTHDTYASHASPRTPLICFLRVVHVRGNLSLAINSVGRTLLLLRIRIPDTILNTVADRSACPSPIFSPNTSIEVVMKAKHPLMNKLHQFNRSITPACDRYVQYLLAGANPSVLTRHQRGLQPWRCQLATSHYSTFPTDGPPLST
jgi:hypothetical protein